MPQCTASDYIKTVNYLANNHIFFFSKNVVYYSVLRKAKVSVSK